MPKTREQSITKDELVKEIIDQSSDKAIRIEGKKITDKQVRFAVEVAKGRPLTEAFKEAGYSQNYTNKKLQVKAIEVAKSPTVELMISRIREQFVEQQVVNLDFLLQELLDILADAKESQSLQIRLKTVEQLAKLTGLNEKQVDNQVVQQYFKFEPNAQNTMNQ